MQAPGQAVGHVRGGDERATPPLVTVLIDNYNYAQFLGAAVDSALAQTYDPVEVLVVDDGSSDGSLELLASYGNRIRVLRLANGGQAAALNAALPLVRGDLLLVLDSDDVLDPDAVERIVAAFCADPACVRVQFRLRLMDADGVRTGTLMPPRRVPLLQGDLRPQLLRHRGWRWPPTSGNAWLTAALRQVPEVPAVSFRQGVDRWWSDLATLLGTVRALDRPAGCYRVHGRNDSVLEGVDDTYLRVRIDRRRELHEASVQVAAGGGLSYPDSLEDVLDAPLAGWRLALDKLQPAGAQAVRFRHGWALYATLSQPNVRPTRRAAHAAWYVALLACPRQHPAARRLVRVRYRAG